MVKIQYRLFEDIDLLKTATTEEFERELNSFWGFFELRINDEPIGFYHSNEIEEWETGGEVISFWFYILMDTIKALRCSDVVTMHIVGGMSFLEFRRKGETLKVKRAVSEKIFENGPEVKLKEIEVKEEEIVFDNEHIRFAELEEEVRKKCGMFIEEVRNLNEELVYSSCVQGLIDELETL
ncbi:hypothetical protein NE619_13755 [Anaerovorax odorimutans]|uniref:Uncharacterized protein n=1 Tax=Anaerovorax odorimutans TaxID=109327 RepID=A0ABT1RRI9_9FIRM|nr:hypothetical protein [Anaerovorax odorimutans]MCQ4637795.1 hypothetical protein [Anaerovorax odorimutans]